MNNLIKSSLTILITCIMTNVGAQISTADLPKHFTKEQQNVMKTIMKMTSSFENKDIDGVMSTYESNSTIVFEPGVAVTNRAEQRELFMGFIAMRPEFTYGDHEVFVNGDIAIHLTPWNMVGKTPDGSELNIGGLSIAVLRKQRNGEWLMVFDDPYGSHLLNVSN